MNEKLLLARSLCKVQGLNLYNYTIDYAFVSVRAACIANESTDVVHAELLLKNGTFEERS